MPDESLDKRGDLVYNSAMTNPKQALQVVAFSSETVEYYTPPEIVEAARSLMGGIDLDPASCVEAQEVVKARVFYTREDDGLQQQWWGRVWLNPPYGKIGNESSQGHWAERLILEYQTGNVSEACLLVRSAPGYEWYEKILDRLPVCWFRDRVEFISPGGKTKGPSKQGASVFYLGENRKGFVEFFGEFGRIAFPEDYKGNRVVQKSLFERKETKTVTGERKYLLWYENGTGWYDCASAHPSIDDAKMAAKGYCARITDLDGDGNDEEDVVWSNEGVLWTSTD